MSLEILHEKLDNHIETDREHKEAMWKEIKARVPYLYATFLITVTAAILGFMSFQLSKLNETIIHQGDIFLNKLSLLTDRVSAQEARQAKIEGILSGYKIEIK
jgi:hypothetical protein